MSSKKREWYPGAMYHVMSRGNRRTVLFKEKADYLRFLECVEKARKILGFQVHALCLMTNHFHMTIETADTELWKIMQRILHPYSIDFNHKYHFTGHLFESRYAYQYGRNIITIQESMDSSAAYSTEATLVLV
jgi:REP element-mobilizing transposase RayT